MSEKNNTRRRRFGDRYEGRRLRSLSPMTYVAPYIMVNRNGSTNLIQDKVAIDELETYIAEKRREGLKGFGMMYVFVAAYIRAVSQYPGINRFLSGQKIYARKNIQIIIDIKKSMNLNAQNTDIKLEFSPDATVYDVYDKFTKAFEENRTDEEVNSFDTAARVFKFIPGLLLKFTVWFLKLLDYFGLLPKFLIDLSPFHGSLFITSMGSLGIPPVFHHLYDFGNIPMFLSFGAKRTEVFINRDGDADERKVIDYTFVTDERICDGHYYAVALKCMKEALKHPKTLDEPPLEVTEDVE